jgi:hypothetical protein
MKDISIIPLAERKLARRGIPREWVVETIRSPDQMVEGYGGRAVAQRRYRVRAKDMLLRVVYDETERQYIVVTAYLTSKVTRNWKGAGDEN